MESLASRAQPGACDVFFVIKSLAVFLASVAVLGSSVCFAVDQQQSQQSSPSRRNQSQQQSPKRLASVKSNQKQSQKSQSVSGGSYAPSNSEVRQFHDVLNDLLSEFTYDVKQGQVNGLKNLSIRRVDISDTLPRTYEQYVELLVSERLRENSKVKLLNCVPCKSKSSTTSSELMPLTKLN
jgi:hypothetical protein